MRFWLIPGFLLAAAAFSAGSAAEPAAPVAHPAFQPEQIEYYQKTVQPILAKNCYKCHGGAEPDAEGRVKVKSGLQLISRLGIVKGGEHGPAYKADNPGESLLLRVVSYDDEHLKMPPTGKLPAAEIAALQRWIEMGLPWTPGEENRIVAVAEDHGGKETGPDTAWTYEPVRQVAVPKLASQPANPIDAFLLQKLAGKGLGFSKRASREVLIRRAYYDLTGLPPTPEEVAAFVRDTDPQAWPKLVDRLLASPHYGEKFARHWLDLVRYAETNGFERDGFKEHIWRYRQWVIDSLNADKPYDRFVKEQLAGDELDDATPESLTATGYWCLMQWDDEPADPLQHAYDVLDDNVRITAETMLGVSIGCARCHNHKTDPITQKDYYSFMAFMHGMAPYSLAGRVRDVTAPGQLVAKRQRRGGTDPRIAEQELEHQLVAFQQEARKRFAAKGEKPSPETGRVLVPVARDEEVKWWHTTTIPDRRWPNPGFDPEAQKWIEAPAPFGTNVPGGRARTPWNTPEIWLRTAFQLTEIPKALTLTIHHDEDAEVYLNGKMVKHLRSHLTEYITVPLGADAIEALQTGKNILAVHVIQSSGGQFLDAGLSVGDPEIASLLEKRGHEVCHPDELAAYKALREQLGRLRAGERAAASQATLAQIAIENGTSPPDIFVHIRGNAHAKGDKVDPAFPAVFKEGAPQIEPGERSSGRRRALAEWIASAANPRTSRVIVNRLWQWHFGRGLCATTNEFGRQGTGVTHPALLDWLAATLVEKGWSLKAMHRLILTSEAWQQESAHGPAAAAGRTADPANTLWWRFDMRRLSSEEIRDSVLAISGNLNRAQGGESFFAPLPEAVLATSSKGRGAWGESPPDQRTRRSIYMKSKRSLSHPLMTDFDQADTDNPCPVRFSTTVPTQALNFLNSEFLNEQSVVFANRLKAEHPGDLAAQVRAGVQLATQRPVGEEDLRRLLDLHKQLMDRHALASDAALDRVCLVILNLNEFIYLD